MSLPSPANPFEAYADPRGYVPREACEDVLRRLERHVANGVPAIVLRGPAGIGKSMLLAILHQRLAERWQVARVAVSPSPSMEISHRVLDLLDADVGEDPSNTLVATARRHAASGRRVLVIIDQATHAPIASSRQLARAAARARGDLCIVFGVTEEEGAEAFEHEISAEAELATLRFDSPMNAEETAEYLARRLDQTIDSQALRDRFDEAAYRYVIDGAGGHPRQVNELAFDALRRLDAGERLPVLDGEATRGAPPTDAPPLQPPPSAYEDAWHADGSLGGGLLGAGPRRDPHELDATRELFPPGFLGSARDPLPPPAPAPQDADTARAQGDRGPGDRQSGVEAEAPAPREAEASAIDASQAPADDVQDVAAEASVPATGDLDAAGVTNAIEEATPQVAAAPSTDAGALPRARPVERAPAPEAPIDPRLATAGTDAASANRQKLWIAALLVAAVSGGYLAGRVDLVSTDSPTPAAVVEPAAPEVKPPLAAPAPPPVRSERTTLAPPNRLAAVPSTTKAAEPEATPSPAAAPPVVATPTPAAAPPVVVKPTPAPAPSVVVKPTPPEPSTRAVATATPAAPKVDESPAASVPATKPAPTPPAVATPVAAAASAPPQPTPRTPAPAPAPEVVRTVEDGSVTAILVGDRTAAQSSERAAAYARVRVEIEPGWILSVDGERLGVAPIADLVMEPGLHRFVAELPDGTEIEQLIQVTPDTGVVEF